MNLFGWEFKRKQELEPVQSFTPKENDDGAVVVAAGGAWGTYIDLDGTVRTEAELVTKYREMALQPECDAAIDEIINETMSVDKEDIVEIGLDHLELSDNVKKIIRDEFQFCLQLLDFKKHAYEIFRRWYVDGRLYYHVIINDKDPTLGIQEVRYIDPRKIRKIREIVKKRVEKGGVGQEAQITKTQNEYYVYNEKGFNFGNNKSQIAGNATNGLKIAKDSIVHVVSGLTDNLGTTVLSYLHKSIKALNQLRTLEDALVIYRLARAPERRIWYIDVGNLPKMKAEQYVRDIMVKHKNRLIYDAATGEVRDDRKFMTMLEDYWLPRREGGRGTEVDTLQGGANLGQMDDVVYFQKKFYQTLNVPVSRLDPETMYSLGRATEITRDELKFTKFVARLRQRFALLFTKILGRQLVLKGIMTVEEWEDIENEIQYEFTNDSYFDDLKDAEILRSRIDLIQMAEPLLGKYYSFEWARKEILHQSDDDIEEQDNLMAEEAASGDPRWKTAMEKEEEEREAQMQMMQAQIGMEGDPEEEGEPGDGSPNFQAGANNGEGAGTREAPNLEKPKDPKDTSNGRKGSDSGRSKINQAKKDYLMYKGHGADLSPAQYHKFRSAAEILGKSSSSGAKALIKRGK